MRRLSKFQIKRRIVHLGLERNARRGIPFLYKISHVHVEDVDKTFRRKIRILVEGNSWTEIAGTLSCLKKKIN